MKKPSGHERGVLLLRAAQLYENFTGDEAEEVARIKRPKIPAVLVCVGEVDILGYTTVREGRTEKYAHEFKGKAKPLFCVTPDGAQIFLIGGEYDFTDRGIVDRR